MVLNFMLAPSPKGCVANRFYPLKA